LEAVFRGLSREGFPVLTIAIMDATFASGIHPGHGTVNAGDHAGSALETAGKLHLHLTAFLVEFVEVGRTGVDAKTFPAGPALPLIQGDVTLGVVLECINSEFLFDLHCVTPLPSEVISSSNPRYP
jgi:hypothetical protein